MAPVDPDVANSNIVPFIRLGSQVLAVGGTLAYLALFFKRSAQDRPPSQEVRVRESRRRRDVTIFAILAAVSLGTLTYFNVSRLVWSYLEWAHVASENVPNTLWSGWYAHAEGEGLLLERWLRDTNIVQERLEIALYKGTSLWWIQQQHIFLVVWSVFVGIEGRQRNLSTLVLTLFVSLPYFSGLSVALNLFNIVLLLTPVPLGTKVTEKNALWTVEWRLVAVVVTLAFSWIASFPYYVSVPGNARRFSLGIFACSILLATALPRAPTSLGKSHRNNREARNYWTSLFVLIALMAGALQVRHSLLAFSSSRQQRQPRRFNLWETYVRQKRSTASQSLATAEDIFSSLTDHPAIAGPAWDVLLCVLSLCTWAVVRGLDPMDMLRNTVMPWAADNHPTQDDRKDQSEPGALSRQKQRRSTEPTDEPPASPTKRGRGRPKKTTATAVTSARGSTLRRSTHRKTKDQDLDSEEESFTPSLSTANETAAFSHDEEGSEEMVQEAEAGALTWVLFVLGGLAGAGCGVLGAEVRRA